MSAALFRKLRSMDGAELRFRAAAALRTRVDRARTVLAPESWRRESLRLSEAPDTAAARVALDRRDWMAAHEALAAHFSSRPRMFALDPRRLQDIAAVIAERFPANDATVRAERILAGEYDLLGYRRVRAGSPPDWHMDPVHRRRAPLAFWDSVPYLDPACGDHKVTWEINRHQHFLHLGRAHALTGDQRFYEAFVSQLTDWIRSNPPLMGTNWASMLELAFRCLSWLWALHFFAPSASRHDATPWTVDLLMALDRQLTHVEQNLSRYFSPNTHLTGEALALYVAGQAVPELASSAARAATGREVLLTEAHRQVLPDGGHAERSAHYHRYSTDFYLLALNIARVTSDPAVDAFNEAAHRQARFLRAIADDTGRLPLTGDDDGGQLFPICGRPPANAADSLATAAVLLDDPALAVGAAPEETLWFCGTTPPIPDLSRAIRHAQSAGFADAGYYVARDRNGAHLVFDCGEHGYLNGGHAHADALAVVASVGGRPLLVDPGTATYTMDAAARDRFRSTAMHNTVLVDGRDQSIPRGPFHWASRTDARCVRWNPGASADYIEGQHAGYRPIIHTRSIIALHGIGWIVIDHLHGAAGTTRATAMWHIHPDWRAANHTSGTVTLEHPDATRAALAASAPLERVTSHHLDEYAPEYGRIDRGLCFAISKTGALPFSIATFVSAAPDCEPLALSEVAVVHRPGAGWHAAAFRIDTSRLSILAASAVETDRLSSGDAPGSAWGLDELRTVDRTVVLSVPVASTMHQVGRL